MLYILVVYIFVIVDMVQCIFFGTLDIHYASTKSVCFNIVLSSGFGKFKNCYFIQKYLTALSKAFLKLVEN